jgi:hypothetical protein
MRDRNSPLAWGKLKEYRFRTASIKSPGLKRRERQESILMNKVLCCLAQIVVLVAGLVWGAQAFAQEPGFPPET